MIDPLQALRKRKVDPLLALTTKQLPPPTLAASSEIANTEEALRSEGVEPIKPEDPGIVRLLENLSRPGAAIRGLSEGKPLSAGFSDPRSVSTGQQQLATIGKRDDIFGAISRKLQTAKLGNKDVSGAAKFLGGTALEVAQDPLTYIGVAPVKVAAGLQRKFTIAGKTIGPDINPAGRALSALANRIPGVEATRTAVGRTFNNYFIPFGATAGERRTLGPAYDVVGNAARKAAAVVEDHQRGVLDDLAAQGVREPAAREGFRLLETLPKNPRNVPYTLPQQLGKIAAAPGYSPEAKKAAELYHNIHRQNVRMTTALGLPPQVLENFVARSFRDDPKIVAEKLRDFRTSLPASYPGRATAIPDSVTAAQFGLHPETDLRVLAAEGRATAVKLQVYKGIVDGLSRLGPDVIDVAPKPGWRSAEELSAIGSYKAAKDLYLHPEVARRIENLQPALTGSIEGERLAKLIHREGMKFWKGVTLASPSFHIRNATGNIWLNMADGVWNPKRYEQAGAVLTGRIPQVELAGRTFSRDEIMKQFKELGLQGQGIFQEAAGPAQYGNTARRLIRESESSAIQRARYGLVPSAENKLAPLNTITGTSRAIGETADSYGRMTNFLHHLDLGESFEQAASSTRKALFDYGDLTPSEQKLREFVIPFYPWMRYNLPKQLELLLTNPKMASSTDTVRRNAAEATGTDESNLPGWLRERGAIPFQRNGDQTDYATLNLPLYDLAQIHDPTDIQNWAKAAVLNLSPVFGIPFQAAFNTQLFSGQPITDTPDLKDEAMKDYFRWIVGQVGGPAGRGFQNVQTDLDRSQEKLVKESKGSIPPPAPPRPFGLPSFLAPQLPVSSQSQSLQAASGIFAQRDLLEQQARSVEKRLGRDLPSATDLRERNPLAAANTPSQFIDTAETNHYRVGVAPAILIQGAQRAGVSRDWEPYLKYIALERSGLDATAPGGLFGLDPTTFYQSAQLAAQRNPAAFSRGFSINDPMQNTLAAIEYVRATYGHPSKIPALTGGR